MGCIIIYYFYFVDHKTPERIFNNSLENKINSITKEIDESSDLKDQSIKLLEEMKKKQKDSDILVNKLLGMQELIQFGMKKRIETKT